MKHDKHDMDITKVCVPLVATGGSSVFETQR